MGDDTYGMTRRDLLVGTAAGLALGLPGLPHSADAASARNLLRSLPDLPEHFNTLFLVDEGGSFMGSVTLARLIVAPEGQVLSGLKSEPLLSLAQESPEKDVIDLFDKYNLLALAVVDEQSHLVGTVTVDDVVTVLTRKG